MKLSVYKGDFIDRFRMFDGRYTQMGGYEGLSALYDYLEGYEEEAEEEIELDVIALCCDFKQYDSIEDVIAEYDKIKDLDDLRDNTQVIEYGEGKLIIQNF
jgi:hypothetical protein